MRTVRRLLLMLIALCCAIVTFAATRGTREEANAMLQRAAEHYKTAGRERALADFNAGKGWTDRDLYVFCIDSKDVQVANAAFPANVGSSVDQLRTTDGRALGKALWDSIANAKEGDGSVRYFWTNPVTRRTEEKSSSVRKFGQDLCGVGVYMGDARQR